ncbi:3-oxoadipate enol-lactonase [Skermania sp. ID1734]|uniref:3-oxoadipate enol-lactonase n=1 Tax=Skermania sp. ID1734 TaxID=2597516 RepID=UPI0011812B2A|nr:3-oxoadipate enol-lactonase [Skermania sp. ID1734]TSE01576.1 3-oxoadipate enol-lactonase [Skermania sp. ID1734]
MTYLAFHRAGPRSGTPIVLIGSLGSTRSMWDPQVESLACEHDVVAIDLPGHGESPLPPVGSTIATFGSEVLALLDELALEAAHVVGLSLGGAIAQWLASHTPDRLSSLTLLCTAARFGEPQGWLDRAAFVRANGTAALAAAVVDRWFSAGLAANDQDLIARSRAMVADTDNEGYARCCEALAAWDGRGDLGRITAPTLVIAGGQDPATTPADLATIADAIPNAKLHILDPGAHLVNVEQPEHVSKLITEHVQEADSR